MHIVRRATLIAALALAFPGIALAGTSAGQPFPSNLYTASDSTQITRLHVDLPKPDCASRPSDCADIAVLNTLDGFNIQPRISIPFSGPIDLSTVSSKTIFLVGPGDHVVGINQIEWEPLTNTLHAESNDQLAQHSTYLLVVTRGVHDANGKPLDAMTFGQTAYDRALQRALPMAMAGGASPSGIADASLFTTQSIDVISRKIRRQLHASTPTFTLGSAGERTVFPFASIAAIQWKRQTGTSTFSTSPLLTPAVAGSVATIAFGSYSSPDYETAAKVIPPYGTATGKPVPQGTNQVEFTLFIPAGVKPAGGWPVAIFGHGFTDSMNGARGPSPGRSRAPESRRSRSTSSATAAARSARTRSPARRDRRSSCPRAGAGSTRTGTGRSTRPRA